jgi:hypothetical protein
MSPALNANAAGLFLGQERQTETQQRKSLVRVKVRASCISCKQILHEVRAPTSTVQSGGTLYIARILRSVISTISADGKRGET